MIRIDNTNKLSEILSFKPNGYYKFVAILRKKDVKDEVQTINQDILLKLWLIDTEEQLSQTLPNMVTFCNKFKHCRLYVTIDRKDIVKSLFELRKKIDTYIEELFYGSQLSAKSLNKIVNSVSSLNNCSHGDKKWLYDIDEKDPKLVEWVFQQCGYQAPILETKNGYHVVVDRTYNAYVNTLPKGVEVKDNALALIYYNGDE